MLGKKTPPEQSLPARRRRSDSETREPAEASRQQRLFQRGRTLTGSVSSHVISTAEHGADLRSPRVHAHHLANLRHRLGLVLVCVLLLGFGTLYLISEFTASVVVSARDATLSTAQQETYKTAIDEYYARHPVERFRFALDKEQLLAYVRTKAPEAKSLAVDGAGGIATSSVRFTMRRPVASWVVDRTVLYVDADGTAFATNYYGSSQIVTIVDESGVPTVNGKTLTSQRFLTFVGKLVGAAADQYGLKVTQALLPRDTTRQVEVRVDGVAYPVKFSVDRPVGQQVEDMTRSINYLKGRGVNPGYLDVRVKEKAFYK